MLFETIGTLNKRVNLGLKGLREIREHLERKDVEGSWVKLDQME